MTWWLSRYLRAVGDKIEQTELTDRITVYRPAGVRLDWQLFSDFVQHDEPVEPFKSSHKRKLFRVNRAGVDCYVKKFSYRYSTRFFAPFRGIALFPSIALQQLAKILYLNSLGISTADPLFVLERRYNLVKHESCLVTRAEPGVSLRQVLKSSDDPARKRKIMQKFVADVEILLENKIHHGDLKNPDNFLLNPQGEIVFIDLDECKSRWLPWRRKIDRQQLASLQQIYF